MTTTLFRSYSTSSAETKKLWSEALFRDTAKKSYFDKFTGDGSNNVVQMKADLTKDKGDQIYFFIRHRTTSGFLASGTPVEGNEQNMSTADDSVTVDEKNFGVKDGGMIKRQRAFYDTDSEMFQALTDQGAENVDQEHFTALDSQNTTVFYKVSGVFTITATLATATAAITATDTLDADFINTFRPWLVTGGNRSQAPIRPIKVDGRDYYILLVHPDVTSDLKKDATFHAAQREALERSKSNPIFSGALGVWDGIIIHEHENIALATNGGLGTNVPYAKCHVLGAQSLMIGWAQKPDVVPDKFSYGQIHGLAWLSMFGIAKPQFTNAAGTTKDYGSVNVILARTQISDKSYS